MGKKERPKWTKELARAALRDLEVNKLEVILVPAPSKRFDSHSVRTVVNKNPEWYRELFERRGKSWVKRCRVIKALKRVEQGCIRSNGYEKEILNVIWPVRKKLGMPRS